MGSNDYGFNTIYVRRGGGRRSLPVETVLPMLEILKGRLVSRPLRTGNTWRFLDDATVLLH